jgi:hypothetical protein
MIVEVTAPDGRREYWAAAAPYPDAIEAVRKLIPADHRAERTFRRPPSTLKRFHFGEVRNMRFIAERAIANAQHRSLIGPNALTALTFIHPNCSPGSRVKEFANRGSKCGRKSDSADAHLALQGWIGLFR